MRNIMGGQNKTLIFKDKPIFGLDIGSSTIKVMQLDEVNRKSCKLQAYGVSKLDHNAIKDGVIEDFDTMAKSVVELFKNNIVGKITTTRVAMTVPSNHTFSKVLTLPKMKQSQLAEAVALESEQYIPMAFADLYFDYSIIETRKDDIEVLVVASPRKIVDSYMTLARMLGLEPIAFETNIGAVARLFEKQDQHNAVPSVLIDIGSYSSDITIHDKTMIVTNTIPTGGEMFTDSLVSSMGVTKEEAHIIKTKYGLGKSKKQKQVVEALKPELEQLIKEIKRMIRYYEDRGDKKSKIGQIVTMGGGANMLGLSEHIIDSLRLPVRTCNPWQNINLNKLQPPSQMERTMYVTVAGLALINSKEIFA
ncbi:MAG: type IV pilus assembly protein PilM [Patescibacteria group bacterium]